MVLSLLEDDFIFGCWCVSCGNATQGTTPYCQDCVMLIDHHHHSSSPTSASHVPLLIPSTKSNCSTPPSSPSPGKTVIVLPVSNFKFDYGDPCSLPLPLSSRYPLSYSISYTNSNLPAAASYPTAKDDLAAATMEHPFSVTNSHSRSHSQQELQYRRKPGGVTPSSSVPAPLYFRQTAATAAAVPPTTSPAMSPRFSSVQRRSFGTALVARPPPSSPTTTVTTTSSTSFILPPSIAAASPQTFHPLPAPAASATNSPVLPSPATHSSHAKDRRLSFPTQLQIGIAALRHDLKRQSNNSDLLMSPRIRALRGSDSPVGVDIVEEELSDMDQLEERGVGELAEEGGAVGERESAFASYLFSHLSGEGSPEEHGKRGRTAGNTSITRSTSSSSSSNSSAAAMEATSRSTSHASIFPDRHPGRRPLKRSSFAPEPRTILLSSPDDKHSASMAATETMKLTPGRLIAATIASSSSSNPSSLLPSPLSTSPPTISNALGLATTAAVAAVTVHRGRSSNLRSFQRSLSPMRDPSSGDGGGSSSTSRGRRSTTTTGSVALRLERSVSVRGDGDRDDREDDACRNLAPSLSKQQRRIRILSFSEEEEDNDAVASIVERERRERRGRSDSRLRRGRGREIVLSGAGYGHDRSSSDDEDDSS